MRTTRGPRDYAGSVFLTKILTDSDGHERRVECEKFDSIARRMGLTVATIYTLANRGGIDGVFFAHGTGWAPVPVSFLVVGEKSRWSHARN